MSLQIIKQKKEYTEFDITHMTMALRGGNTDMIVPLIEAHIVLANKIAFWYIHHNLARRDDIYAVAFSGLVDCINHCQHKLVDNNISAYAARCIKGAIQMFLVRDSLIPIPRKEFKERIINEDPFDFVQRTATNPFVKADIHDRGIHESGVIENIAIILPLTDKTMEDLDVPVMDYSMQKIEDLYNKYNLTAQESQVTDMRLDGLTLEEIGQKLGMTKMGVHYIIQDIKRKLVMRGFKNAKPVAKISGTKVCSRCKIELSLSLFYEISEGSYKSTCKHCMKEARDAKVHQTADIH